jgi:hypothetical protein
MHQDHNVFIDGIIGMKKVTLNFFSKEDGRVLTRLCAPMDFGPSRRAKDKSDRYHFWDYESDTRNHVLSLVPGQVQSIDATDEQFEPLEFMTWPPNWFYARDWGQFS